MRGRHWPRERGQRERSARMKHRGEDGRRYAELTARVEQMLREARAARAGQRVAPEDMADYREWLALAREASPRVAPFVHRTSPYVTLRWGARSYRQMASDFHWLTQQLGLPVVEGGYAAAARAR